MGTVGGVISMINYSTIIGIWWNLNRNILIMENIYVIVLSVELITKRWRIMSNYDITQFWYITILVPNYTSYITLNNNILVLRSKIQLIFSGQVTAKPEWTMTSKVLKFLRALPFNSGTAAFGAEKFWIAWQSSWVDASINHYY